MAQRDGPLVLNGGICLKRCSQFQSCFSLCCSFPQHPQSCSCSECWSVTTARWMLTCVSSASRMLCVLCEKFRRSKGGWTAFRMGVCHSWKEWVSPLLQRCASNFSSHRRTGTGEVSLLIRSHVACVKNKDKNKQGFFCRESSIR